MFFIIRNIDITNKKYSNYKLKGLTGEKIKEFIHSFPEVEIVENSIYSSFRFFEYYYISPQNIRKLKLLNIDSKNKKTIKLFKILYNKNIINNYGDEKPSYVGYIGYSTPGTWGTSRSAPSGSSNIIQKMPRISKNYDPHKIINKSSLKLKKRFKV